MAEYATSFDKAGGYSFNEEAIADLWKQVHAFVGKDAQVEVTLEGDQRIKVNDAKELLDDAFVKRNIIVQISIYGNDYAHKPRKAVSISLRRDVWRTAVSVSLSGDRHECTTRRGEIENIIEASRLWYSPVSRDSQWIYFATGVATGALVLGYDFFNGQYTDTFWKLMIAVAGVYLGLSFLFSFIKRWLFPNMVFEIGKSARYGERAKFWRNTIGIVIILGLIVGVIAGLVVERMK